MAIQRQLRSRRRDLIPPHWRQVDARQRPSGGHWEGAVDIVCLDSRTVHVCDRFHANSADAVLDAAVDAMRLAGIF